MPTQAKLPLRAWFETSVGAEALMSFGLCLDMVFEEIFLLDSSRLHQNECALAPGVGSEELSFSFDHCLFVQERGFGQVPWVGLAWLPEQSASVSYGAQSRQILAVKRPSVVCCRVSLST